MIETQFSIFDAVVIGVMLISCVFAFFRGFVREILSLGAWIGAAVVTVYYFPAATDKLEPYFKQPVIAAGFATLGLYITALMGFSLINMLILKFLKSGEEIGPIDNIFGLIFGAVRGAFILSLTYFLIASFLPESEYPDWLKQSVTRPYVEKGGLILVNLAPDYLRDLSDFEKKTTTRIKEERKNEEAGYSQESAQKLGRMIESLAPSAPKEEE